MRFGIFMDELIGVKKNNISNFDFEIFPNPAKGKFKVRSSMFEVLGSRLGVRSSAFWVCVTDC